MYFSYLTLSGPFDDPVSITFCDSAFEYCSSLFPTSLHNSVGSLRAALYLVDTLLVFIWVARTACGVRDRRQTMSSTEQLVCLAKSFPSFRASRLCNRRGMKYFCSGLTGIICLNFSSSTLFRTLVIHNIKQFEAELVPHLDFRGTEKGRLCRTARLNRGLLLWIIK